MEDESQNAIIYIDRVLGSLCDKVQDQKFNEIRPVEKRKISCHTYSQTDCYRRENRSTQSEISSKSVFCSTEVRTVSRSTQTDIFDHTEWKCVYQGLFNDIKECSFDLEYQTARKFTSFLKRIYSIESKIRRIVTFFVKQRNSLQAQNFSNTLNVIFFEEELQRKNIYASYVEKIVEFLLMYLKEKDCISLVFKNTLKNDAASDNTLQRLLEDCKFALND